MPEAKPWSIRQFHDARKRASPPRLQQFCDQPSPAGLVRGANTAPAVPVEIFVKQNVVLEMRIAGQLGMILQHGPLTVRSTQKQRIYSMISLSLK